MIWRGFEASGTVKGPIAGDPGKRYGSRDGRVAELADAPDLGSGPERGGGSIPPSLILFLSRSVCRTG